MKLQNIQQRALVGSYKVKAETTKKTANDL